MTKISASCLLLVLGVAAPCVAQSNVQVVVLDGHNGKPITRAKFVTVEVLRDFETRQVTATIKGDKYVAKLDHADAMVLSSVTRSELSWNQYKLCVAEQDVKPIYSVATIMSTGLAAPNNCNKKITAATSPGEIVFFVTQLPFWQRLHLFQD